MIRWVQENFSGFRTLPTDFTSQLDRMFALVFAFPPLDTTSTTLSGFAFRDTDRLGSLYVDTTSGNITIYLPTNPTGTRRRTITKLAAANVVTINGNGHNINGVTTQTLTNKYDSITVEPTGTEWIITSIYP